jgi:Dolichyl-phosphate-mannose-protein mannosyltransferase
LKSGVAARFRPWLVVALVILATASLRLRLIDSPLERDEGEYAYAGQLMLQGIPPYRLACNMKLPGTYAVYAVILAAWGQTIAAIHTGLLLANAGAIVLLYLLGRRLLPVSAALAACAAYALLSVGAGVLGTQAHATHFVVLAALAGLLLLLRYAASARPWTLWWSGWLFGLSFVMKQHGIFFALFGAAYLVATHSGWRGGRGAALLKKLTIYLAGAVTPFALTCLILWRAGVFGRFWFWTFTYARHYGSENSLADAAAALAETFGPILRQSAGLWILALAGLVLAGRCIWKNRRWIASANPKERKPDSLRSACFIVALLVFSFAAVCPGLYFRAHYVVLMLPAVALLAGSWVRGRISGCLFAAALMLSVITQREFLFRMSPVDVSRGLYGLDPFPEAIRMGAYIRQHTASNALIAVLGSEPEIYFYAGRHSATSYLYTEPMVEPQPFALAMQNDMVRELERNTPEYVVRFPIEETLSLAPQSPTRLYDWWADYGPQHYQVVAIAQILPDGSTEYRWDAAAEAYRPKSLYYLAVYRRK